MADDNSWLSEVATPASSSDNSWLADVAIPAAKIEAPAKTEKSGSFVGDMINNTQNAIQSGGDLLSGIGNLAQGKAPETFDTIGHHVLPEPKTQALADKLFPKGSDGSAMDAAHNAVSNTVPSDYSSSLLEEMGNSAYGKALDVIGGNPLYNAVGTAINRDVNPFISKHTGIAEPNLQLMELGLGTLGLKKAGNISDPATSAVKAVAGKVADAAPAAVDAVKGAVTGSTPLTASNVADIAHRSYAAADELGGALHPDAVNEMVDNASKIGPQTEGGKDFAGDNLVTKTIADLQKLKDKPMSLGTMQEVDEELGSRIDSHVDAISGPDKVAKKLIDIQDNLRKTFLNPDANIQGDTAGVDAWREGQQLWATKMRIGDVERMMNKADSADVPSTSLKNQLKTYTNKPANRRGWSDDEWDNLQQGAKTGLLTGAAKFLGSKLVDGIAGASASPFGGIPGAMVGAGVGAALGYPFRQAATALQRRPALKAIDSLTNRPVIDSATQPPDIDSFRQPNADLQKAIDEWGSLKQLESHLTNSVAGKAQFSNQQGGFWRRRTLTDAANDAKSLDNVKGQIATQEDLIKGLQAKTDSAQAGIVGNLPPIKAGRQAAVQPSAPGITATSPLSGSAGVIEQQPPGVNVPPLAIPNQAKPTLTLPIKTAAEKLQQEVGAPQTAAQQPAEKAASGDGLKDMITPIAQQFGNDPALMHKMAMVESGGNPNAKNPVSNAMGLYQFTPQTWQGVVQKYGPSLGVNMRDRVDPVKNTLMANALMKENRDMLQKTLGREPTGGELYLAHFLGAGDTQKLLRNLNNNQITAARLMPAAAQSNPTKFFDKGRPLTPAEVYQKVTSSVGA